MYDITYCYLNNTDWDCPKKDTCKRWNEQSSMPEGTIISTANLFNLCREDESFRMYMENVLPEEQNPKEGKLKEENDDNE